MSGAARLASSIPDNLWVDDEEPAATVPAPMPAAPAAAPQQPTLGTWADRPSEVRRKRCPTQSQASWVATRREACAMADSADWSAARPVHFVALYALMHERVYGAAVAELGVGKTRGLAACVARHAMARDFADDPVEMAKFMHWCWTRELRREELRRKAGHVPFRITWRYQFGGGLVTDYRISQERAR